MDDCTSSEKNSISSSEKESLDRLLHRNKKNTRRVDDSADSEDEKVLFGSGEYKQNNQQQDKNVRR